MMRRTATFARARPPAVAGYFYPDDPARLRDTIAELMVRADAAVDSHRVKALIVPHAGYIYSGRVAAEAFRSIGTLRDEIERVILIGPAHRVPVDGIAVPTVDAFRTPLGDLPIDDAARESVLGLAGVVADDGPHADEHCLEVELPFLQMALGEIRLLPLLVGRARPEEVAAVLDRVWGGPETLIVASSDLSHYHGYEAARRLDAQTAAAILGFRPTLTAEQACGAAAINGLLVAARHHGLNITEIARLNSGDTAGDRERVVGYGSFALYAAR